MAEQTVTLRIKADAQGLTSGVARARRETRSLGDEGQAAGRKLGGGIAAARTEIERTGTLINQVKGFVGGLAAAFVSYQSVKALARMADEWSDLTSLVKVNIGATEDANAVMERLTQVARGTYSSLRDTAQSFAANATTLNALGKSTQEQLEYTTALNNALVISGAKGEQFAQVQDALSKAMATGALRGEELNTVLGRGSAVAEALAAELGTSALELRQLGADGKITGDVIFTALVRRMGELEERAESMPATIGDAFTVFRNALLSTVGYADSAAGATNGIAEAIIDLADVISRPEVKEGFAAVAIGAVNAAAEVAKLFGEVKKVADFAGRLAGMKLTGWLDPDDLELGRAKFRELSDELIKLQNGERSWSAVTEKQRQARIAYLKEEIAKIQENAKAAIIYQGQVAAAAEDAESAAKKAAEEAERQRQASLDALRAIVTGSGDAEDATRSLADAQADLYTHLTKVTDATDDVDAMLRSLTRTLADDATRAQMDYQDNLADILHLELQWMALGPLSEAQIAKLNEARALAGQVYRQDMEALNAETVRAAERAAEESTRAWERFSYDLADAALDGTEGVKRWWKRMLDDMKRQLIQSGLLRLFGSLFNTGGAQAGSGFGSMFSAMFGGGRGMIGSAASGGSGLGIGSLVSSGGSLFSGLATAISGGISSGLMGLGGTLAGLGMGGLGGGLAWAGSSVATHGLIGGLGGSFMTGLGNLFGAGGGALMGIGQMIPAIAAIAGVAAAIQKISGGKLFGTSYQFDSAGRTLDFSATGASGQDRVTEVRQRSLFRGRRWRDTYSDLPDDVADAIGQFWDEVAASNIAIAGDAARTVGAQIRQEFDRAGNVTSTIVEVIGRQWRESLEEAMTRIAAENVIANIDAMLGTTVTRTAPGTGPGQTGPGGGRGIDGLLPIDTIIKTTQQVGEAFAIAERWRHDADLLAEGAQMLLLAATDIKAGAGLLGDGSLTAVAGLIEDLAFAGEPLADAYVRVATSAALLDQALALSGVQIDGTREHIVRLATDITTAAGGLERASALWGNYFDRFYTGIERGEYVLAQAQASAAKEFGDIGLDYTQFVGEGGTQAFRELFESVLPTLSAEAIVEWLEAAAALGIVIDATDALNAALGEVGEVITTVSQTADQLAAVNDILDGNAWDLALAGMTDAEAAIARINHQYDQQRAELLANAATLEQLTTLESQRAQALANQQAAMLAQRASITGNLQRDIDQLGMSDYEREIAGIHAQRQAYIDSLVATGMPLAEATVATREWHDAMLGAAAAAEEAARAAAVGSILQPIVDDIERMQAALSDIGLSDYAREQARIARETQQAVTAAAAAGATQVERLSIEIRGLERAAIAAALAAANFASELADWEFEDYLAGLSEADAQRARVDRQWESRYMRAVEIFGEGSEEAIRVLGLWDNAVARLGDNTTVAVDRMQRATVQMGDILEGIKTWAGKLNESIAHLRPGDEMERWISELSGLPTLAQKAVRRPLAEVVQLVRDEYLAKAAELQQQLYVAWARYAALPWNAQAEMHTLEGQIAALERAMGSITGQMGSALDTLKRMYIASLQGVRDYLDSMLLGDLSALTPAERIAEAWDQLTAAVEAGEGDAATRLADTYLRLLREFEASGDDYNTGFWAVRDLLEGMFDIDWDALLGPDGAGATDSDNIAHMAGTVDAQLAAAQVANDWLAQIAANTGGGWGMPSYDVGTYNVPATGPAILHAGEMVLPRPMADAMRQGAFGGGDTQALETRLDAVIARLDRIDKTTAQGAQAVSQAIVTTGATSDRNADASRARHAQAQRRGVTA